MKIFSTLLIFQELWKSEFYQILGPVKFQNKRMEVGDSIPTIGLYNQGDIIWHDAPSPGGNLGWICIRTGTPGEWRSFGTISG